MRRWPHGFHRGATSFHLRALLRAEAGLDALRTLEVRSDVGATLRVASWLAGSALVLCDVHDTETDGVRRDHGILAEFESG